MTRGLFVAFEGGEASGKSTQAALLAQHLNAVLTREPGGTVLGEKLRSLLLDPANEAPTSRAEALLMVAARAQHVAEVVEPALADGRDVVTDRFSGSTVAYQGHGRGLDPAELADLSSWASGGLQPDLNVLLDVPRELALSRIHRPLDRLEQAGELFHQAVQQGFIEQAERDPAHWLVLDGAEPPEVLAQLIAEAVDGRRPPKL